MSEEILRNTADNAIEDEYDSIDADSPSDEEEVELELDAMFAEKKEQESERKLTPKEYSERLNKEREKFKAEGKEEARTEMAKTLGHESFDDLLSELTDRKLIDEGYEPDKVKSIVEDLIYKHPKYKELETYKLEREKQEAENWAKQQLGSLNHEFGTKYNSIDDLDEETISLFNKGVDLKKAFIANNSKLLEQSIIRKLKKSNSGKEHLSTISDSGAETGSVKYKPTEDEIRRFRKLSPDATIEDISKFLEKNRK